MRTCSAPRESSARCRRRRACRARPRVRSRGSPKHPPQPIASTREDQKEVMVTVYNGNLGLVKDVREARLPSGLNEVQFMDVAALIDPTTVHLKSLTDPTALKILEQNYEYDLVSIGKLM